MDDLLISGVRKDQLTKVAIGFLPFLEQEGLGITRTKLQCVERDSKFLGHLISEGKRKLNPEKVLGIINMPLPRTKRDLGKFLGLYALRTKDYIPNSWMKDLAPFFGILRASDRWMSWSKLLLRPSFVSALPRKAFRVFVTVD